MKFSLALLFRDVVAGAGENCKDFLIGNWIFLYNRRVTSFASEVGANNFLIPRQARWRKFYAAA